MDVLIGNRFLYDMTCVWGDGGGGREERGAVGSGNIRCSKR